MNISLWNYLTLSYKNTIKNKSQQFTINSLLRPYFFMEYLFLNALNLRVLYNLVINKLLSQYLLFYSIVKQFSIWYDKVYKTIKVIKLNTIVLILSAMFALIW